MSMYGSNLPDDWGCYFTTCSAGHRYHLSEGGCGECAESLGTEEERLWDNLISRMSQPGFSVSDVVSMVNTGRAFYSSLFDKVGRDSMFICVETQEPDGVDEIHLTRTEWHNVTRTLRLALCAREDWE